VSIAKNKKKTTINYIKRQEKYNHQLCNDAKQKTTKSVSILCKQQVKKKDDDERYYVHFRR
jgi:hypothetical protein